MLTYKKQTEPTLRTDVPPQNNNITIEHDNKTKSFIFYKNTVYVGKFIIYEFIKYILHGTSNKFLVRYTDSPTMIETYVCIRTKDPNNKNIITFIDHRKSPFTGNIEMLLHLYTHFSNFEKKELDNELTSISSDKDKKIITELIHRTIIQLLEHILRIISFVVPKLSSTADIKIKKELLDHSVGIINKLSKSYTRLIDEKINQNTLLVNESHLLNDAKDVILKKMDNIQRTLDQQTIDLRVADNPSTDQLDVRTVNNTMTTGALDMSTVGMSTVGMSTVDTSTVNGSTVDTIAVDTSNISRSTVDTGTSSTNNTESTDTYNTFIVNDL